MSSNANLVSSGYTTLLTFSHSVNIPCLTVSILSLGININQFLHRSAVDSHWTTLLPKFRHSHFTVNHRTCLHWQCKSRPKDTFAATQHCHCFLPVIISNPAKCKRLSWLDVAGYIPRRHMNESPPISVLTQLNVEYLHCWSSCIIDVDILHHKFHGTPCMYDSFSLGTHAHLGQDAVQQAC